MYMPETDAASIQRALGRIESHVESIRETQIATTALVTANINRISILEKWQARTIGVVVGGTTVISVLFAILLRAVDLLRINH